MKTGEWIVSRKRNEVQVQFKGKMIPLRITLHQMQRYEDWVNQAAKKAGEQQEAGLTDTMKRLYRDAIDVVEIALNPLPNQIDATREEIEAEFDVDQIRLLAQTWIQRKIFEPRYEADPILGLQSPQENDRAK